MKKLTALIIVLCLLAPAAFAGEHFFIIMLGGKLWDGSEMKMSVTPIEGYAPLTVTMAEQSGVKEITRWEWDFGDGSPVETKQDLQHVYEKAGDFIVTLTVFNDKGEKATDTITVKVTEKKVPGELTTYVTAYTGATPIKDVLTTKATEGEKIAVLKASTDDKMKVESYPLTLDTKAVEKVLKIERYKCDSISCRYWIYASRGGAEIAIDNPVIISPPPTDVVVSEVYDDKTDTLTVTLKEDPKAAVQEVLQRLADNTALGKAKVGTKE
jgi:PKD repeat protein